MLFKDYSCLELWKLFCSAELDHLCNLGLGHHEEQFCIWTSGSGGDVILKHFLSRALVVPFFGGANPFVQFWWTEVQFCEIILNLYQLLRRRCRLQIFLI